MTDSIAFKLNDKPIRLNVDGDRTLLWVLRTDLGLTGTKFGCGVAQCGACTVHAKGVPVRSCVLTIEHAAGMEFTTIEGIGATPMGQRVQQAWLAHDVPQCGYCQGGQIMAATALLTQHPQPSEADIDNAMSGNICRCATYVRIRAAIKDVAESQQS